MGTLIPDNWLADWLNTIMYENKWFIWNYWSFIHYGAGFFLAKWVKNWFLAFILLVMYEIFEFFLYGVMFRMESWKDIIWDIVVGMAGWLTGRYVWD